MNDPHFSNESGKQEESKGGESLASNEYHEASAQHLMDLIRSNYLTLLDFLKEVTHEKEIYLDAIIKIEKALQSPSAEATIDLIHSILDEIKPGFEKTIETPSPLCTEPIFVDDLPIKVNSATNPLKKGEQFAINLRKAKKSEKLSKLREQFSNQQQEHDITIKYGNLRGINSDTKCKWIDEELVRKETPDVVMITETKLTKQLEIPDLNISQTAKNRSGGCANLSNRPNYKHIKSLSNSISWCCIGYSDIPVHFISVYVHPQNKDKSDKTIEHLNHILDLILSRSQASRIVIAGDFNERIEEVAHTMKERGLSSCVPAEQPTHNKGRQLDQIFTTLVCTNLHIEIPPSNISDHSIIHATLRLTPSSEDLRLSNLTRVISQKAQREAAIGLETQAALLKVDNILSSKTYDIYSNQLKDTGRKWQWYYPLKQKLQRLPNSIALGIDPTWRAQIKNLETLFKESKTQEFHKLCQQLTKIKSRPQPVSQLQHGGKILNDPRQIAHTIANHLVQKGNIEKVPQQELHLSHQNLMLDHPHKILFTEEEIGDAIKSCNFTKGMGPDGFDGRVLKMNRDLEAKVKRDLSIAMNSCLIPEHISTGRFVPLQKSGSSFITPDIDSIRPIVIRSHLSKIIEKAILLKLKALNSKILASGAYQRGFKEGKSTGLNLHDLFCKMYNRKGQKGRIHLFLDLSKAFDTIKREKLFQILERRCTNEEERHILKLITQLHSQSTIELDGETYIVNLGISQGSVLSPLLFNVYLDEMLKDNPRLNQLLQRGDIKAFADDIIFNLKGISEARTIISDIEGLEQKWGLHINKKKSCLLGYNCQEQEIQGIPCARQTKYLGMRVSVTREETISFAKSDTKRYLKYFKYRLDSCNNDVKEYLLQCYSRSLITYMMSPLLSSGAVNCSIIDGLEASHYRYIYGAPRSIANKTLTNLTQKCYSASDVCMRQSKKFLKSNGQLNLKSLFNGEDTADTKPEFLTKKRNMFYLPRGLTQLMLALASGKTLMHFNEHELCQTHQKHMDLEHMRECNHMEGTPDITRFLDSLKRGQKIFDWEEKERTQAIQSFTEIQIRLKTLRDTGILQKFVARDPVEVTKMQNAAQSISENLHNQAHKPRRGRPPKIVPIDSTQRRIGDYPQFKDKCSN